MNETEMRGVIERKRDGESLEVATLEAVVAAYMDGVVDDAQMSAFAMACVWRGLNVDEAAGLTSAMVASGATLSYPDDVFVVDKHSSGGVSDIVSLVAVPLVASCGVPVAKLSGRALGHTGGTVDKLETIPGFNIAPSMEEFVRQVEKVGCAIAAQTDAFVPADRRLYKLRDRTATVPSTGLIAASIVSKKVAGGAKAFVFDVKCGTAAFMRDARAATELAQALVDISARFGRKAHAVVTDMNEPLGRTIGTGIELIEARDTLRGIVKDARAREGCLRIASEMLEVAGVSDPASAVAAALDSGRGYEKLIAMVAAQGGDVRAMEAMSTSATEHTIVAPRDGYVTAIDAVALGNIGRELSSRDAVAGVRVEVRSGERVSRGALLARVFGKDAPKERIANAFSLGETEPAARSLVYAII
jgi:pyrimidine-nucleoside phosphorylase